MEQTKIGNHTAHQNKHTITHSTHTYTHLRPSSQRGRRGTGQGVAKI